MSSSRFDVTSDSEEEQEELSGSNSLPTEPPFTAYLTNLKPEVTDKDLRDFFSELELISLELFEGKGEGKAEFKDQETLVRALFYSGRLLLGREVKMDAKPKGAAKAKGAGNGAGAKAAATGERAPAQGGGDRGGGRGGGFRGGGRGERGRGGRGEGRGQRVSIFGHSGGRAGGGSGGSGGDEGGEGGEGSHPEKKERPRLQLKPRSKPLEVKEVEDASVRKPSIFGGGKPHDELEFSKKWREKHVEDPEEHKSYSIRGDRTKARSGSFSGGDAPPARSRSGSIGAEGGRGVGGAAGAGRGGGAAGGGSKKPSKPKPKVGEDGWCEVEAAAGEGKAPQRLVEQETKEEDAGRAVGGGFAALSLLDDSDSD